MHAYGGIHIAKFKIFRQYQWRATSPNLMLANFTRYTVRDISCALWINVLQNNIIYGSFSYRAHEYLHHHLYGNTH